MVTAYQWASVSAGRAQGSHAQDGCIFWKPGAGFLRIAAGADGALFDLGKLELN
jgi:hypothetical protein